MLLAVDLRGLGETEDEPIPFRKGMTSENVEHRIAQSRYESYLSILEDVNEGKYR